MKLSPQEQAVLDAYRSEAAQLGRRKALYLTQTELAARTGLTVNQCRHARSELLVKRILRKMGFSVPMKVELL